MRTCPKCGVDCAPNSESIDECPACGVIYGKARERLSVDEIRVLSRLALKERRKGKWIAAKLRISRFFGSGKFFEVCVFMIILLFLAFYVYREYVVRSALERVQEVLSDPDSAKFREVSIKGGRVCGQVNSKNKMGGYVGYRWFIVISDPPRRVYVDGDGDDLANALCYE